MNRLVLIVCWSMLLNATAWAERVYISENIKLPVRQGAGNNNKIIDTLTSGDQVEVVQKGDDWSKIRFKDGKEGWAPSRFLTTLMPCSAELRLLENKYEALTAQTGVPQEDFLRLKEENQKIAVDQQDCSKQLQALHENYETLKNDSLDVIKLKDNYQNALSKNSELARQVEQLELSAKKSMFIQNCKWFLAGACVFGGGVIFGFLIKRNRHYSLIR